MVEMILRSSINSIYVYRDYSGRHGTDGVGGRCISPPAYDSAKLWALADHLSEYAATIIVPRAVLFCGALHDVGIYGWMCAIKYIVARRIVFLCLLR